MKASGARLVVRKNSARFACVSEANESRKTQRKGLKSDVNVLLSARVNSTLALV